LKLNVFALIGGVALFAASGAQAGDMTCVWSRLPDAGKERYFAAPPATAGQKFGVVFSDQEIEKAALGCGYAGPMDAQADITQLVYVSRRAHSERWLATHDQIAPERLDAAWAALSRQAKAELAADLKAERPWKTETLQAFGDKLGLTAELSEPSLLAVSLYLASRVMIEVR
jgi:hypothetical protein